MSGAYHDFLLKYGYAVLGNGSFQLVNPTRFSPVLAHVFRKDSEFVTDRMCVIGMTAFGDLLICQKDLGLVDVAFALHWISQNDFAANFGKQIDQSVRSAIFAKVEEPDNYDEAGQPLFERCRAKLGALDSGQIYAPILPPAAGAVWISQTTRWRRHP